MHPFGRGGVAAGKVSGIAAVKIIRIHLQLTPGVLSVDWLTKRFLGCGSKKLQIGELSVQFTVRCMHFCADKSALQPNVKCGLW